MNVRNLISIFVSALLIFLAVVPVEDNNSYHIDDQYWVCLSSDFTKYQTAAIWDGLNLWTSLGRTHFLPKTDGLCNVLIRPVKGKEAERLEKKWHDDFILGYADIYTNTIFIFIDRVYGLDELRIIAGHEAGHWIALDHIPMDRPALMNPSYRGYYNQVFQLYPADIEEYCRHWNCKNIDTSKIRWLDDTNATIDSGNDLNEEMYDKESY